MRLLLPIFYLLFICVNTQAQTMSTEERNALPQIKASVKGGFFEKDLSISLSFEDDAAIIYYTLDGRPPSPSTDKYIGPIKINSNTSLQTIAYSNKKKVSEPLIENYFIRERNSAFPIISITINPTIFYDPVRGLMKRGPRADKEFPHKGANYYSNREVISHIEIFESPDSAGQRLSVYRSRIGLTIFGGISRIFPQKSFALYARKEYGNANITQPIFPDLGIKKYKRLVLRNSGSDYGETHFRDAFITSQGKEMGLEVQAYRPSLVFVNGRYHGVMNIREKLTKHYFEEHFDIHPDSIDLLEGRGYIKAGSRKEYDRLQSYLSKNDLKEEKHFRQVEKMVDVNNFIEFQVIQIFSDNQDAGGNVKFWREQKKGSKWRWVLFDTDFGFGHYSKGGYNFNTLKMQSSRSEANWPNPDWSTFNLRMLLKNENFRKRFLTRFCDRMNSTFLPDRLTARIDSMATYIKPEMPRHWQRWGLSPGDWDFRVNQMKEFAEKRPKYMKSFLMEKFPIYGKEVQLKLNISGGGRLRLNKIIEVKDSFSGFYFKKLDIELTALPYFGYVFSHWEYNAVNMSKNRIQEFGFETDTVSIRAIFVKKEHPNAKQIIINEISCRDTFSGDWIEFYNNSDKDLNLKDWILRDADENLYIFPKVTIKKQEFLILCREKEKFIKQHPNVKNVLGGLSFGLDRRKDGIELYTASGEPVDSVGYKIGRSKDSVLLVLVLRDFETNNGDYERNWKYDRSSGSPGAMNPIYLQWKNKTASASDDGENLNKFMRNAKLGIWLAAIFILGMACYIGFRQIIKNKKNQDSGNIS